ncbi:MAG: hypothetical protein ACOYCE_11335 [Limnochordia bacterium]|jgi:hypothetical protein
MTHFVLRAGLLILWHLSFRHHCLQGAVEAFGPIEAHLIRFKGLMALHLVMGLFLGWWWVSAWSFVLEEKQTDPSSGRRKQKTKAAL